MKLSGLLMSVLSGLTVMATAQAAQAQNSIPITGGSIEVRGLNNAANTTATFITPQGTVSSDTARIVSVNGWLNPCCSIVGHLSGVGFSPSGGPIVYSNLPFAVETIGGHAYLPISGGARREIRGGMINGAYTDHSVARARTMHTPGVSIMRNLNIQSNVDLSPGKFFFEKPAIAPTPSPVSPSTVQPTAPSISANTFSLPEHLTEPGNPNASAEFTTPTETDPTQMAQSAIRHNGVHTRIMPVWTPGLYQ